MFRKQQLSFEQDITVNENIIPLYILSGYCRAHTHALYSENKVCYFNETIFHRCCL